MTKRVSRISAVLVIMLAISGAVSAATDGAVPATQPTTKAVMPTANMVVATPVTVAPKVDPIPAEKIATATVETQAWWQYLVMTIIQIVGAIAVPVLSTLLIVLLRRWNIKVEYEKAAWVAGKAKDFAEQKARVALKDGKTLDAPEVAKIALEQARLLGQGKLAPWATRMLQDLIEAKVGQDNTPAANVPAVVTPTNTKPV